MMTANLFRVQEDKSSCTRIISRKKAQKAQKECKRLTIQVGSSKNLLRPEEQQLRDHAEINKLCDIIRETSFDIHKFLRSGHLEKVYENALTHRLSNMLVVEIKACRGLVDEHLAQLLGYLRASRIEHGLLINFGAQKLQIKKYVLTRND